MSFFHSKSGIITALIITSIISSSLSNAGSGDRGRPHGPPPEAIEACAGFSEGDTCSFSGRRGKVEGTCIVSPRDEETLACAPEGGPPPEGGRPE